MDNFLKIYKPAYGHEKDRTLEYYEQIFKNYDLKIKIIKPIFYFMNTPIDIERINNKLLALLIKSMWRINGKVTYYFKKLEGLGRISTYLLAMILYCFDRIILKFTSIGPSTKLLLAKPI